VSKFLLGVDTGMPERIYDMLEFRKTAVIRPFEDTGFRELFDAYLRRTKRKIPDRTRRLRNLREKFRIVVKPDVEQSWWTAETLEHEIILYRGFFVRRRARRVQILAHELVHIVQFLLARKDEEASRPYGGDTLVRTRAYFNDRDEVEPWTQDFFIDILRRRAQGKLKTESAVVKWLYSSTEFRQFYKRNQSRMIKKILFNLRGRA